jgi:cytochrome d ubiquinol oxidase subunit I
LDAVALARLQFGLTVGFHFIFPPLTIGLGWLLAWFLYRRWKTGDESWNRLADFWLGPFALTFTVGVATGIVMEFQFGTNWAVYSRFVGDIFGAPLAAEGVLAFFMESIFLGVLLWGGKRLTPGKRFFSSLMVAVGSTLSGFWIIAANSWQQTPAGYRLSGGRAELTDFFEAVFNASTIPRYLHTIDGAMLTGSLFVMGISAWYLLKGVHRGFSARSMKAALAVAAAASIVQLGLGHFHAVQVANTQPAKLAAFEGLWETQKNAPLLLFGVPDGEREVTDYAVTLPGLLSIGVAGTPDAEIKGLKAFAREDRPPILPVFMTFHLMVGLGFFFIGFGALGALLWWRGRLFDFKPYLWLAVASIPLPFIANELGWVAAEMGRQPWVVQGVLRTSDAVSPNVPAGHVLASIIMFSAVYALLFALWIFLLRKKIARGPEGDS